MKVGVIADSHDRLPTLRRATALFKRLRVGAVFHAGDFIAPFAARLISEEELPGLPVHCVYGNNDGEKKGLKVVLPQVVDGPLTVKLAGKTIVMHHFIDWLKPADYAAADVVITGHTHQVVSDFRGGKLFLNPGECCGWVHDKCTVALLDLATMKAEIIEVHE
jgi:putative phosphoesterase